MQLTGNYIFVRPGEKAFFVASNYVNYVELGNPVGRGFYLVAEIQDDEFLVSARLFGPDRQKLAEVIRNNVIEGSAKIQFIPLGGYELTTPDGTRLLRLEISGTGGHICKLLGRFYDESGELIAAGDEEDLRIYRAPAVLGKSGSARGIVIEAPVTSAFRPA